MPSALAIFAHPDDIEFYAAGTLLLLRERGWDIHYFTICNGSGGSVQMDAPTTAAKRFLEAQQAANILGARFYSPICNDLELTHSIDLMRRVAAVVREARPSVVLTHSPEDYMEDHMISSRLAVTGAFVHGVPNVASDPPREAYFDDVTVYHGMPHGLCNPLRQKLRAGLYVDVSSVHDRKRTALAAHESQKHWLDVSQGMDSYLVALDDMSRAVGRLSGRFTLAEGWRRHLHLGYSARDVDPLREVLADCSVIDETYEAGLSQPL